MRGRAFSECRRAISICSGVTVWAVPWPSRAPVLQTVKKLFTLRPVIESFKHKGLQELFEKGSSAKVQRTLGERVLRRLDAIDAAKPSEALNLPGFDFHGLQGKPKRYSIHVNGPWCITFEWQGENALKVDLENYH
jgi:toxin HigB-1